MFFTKSQPTYNDAMSPLYSPHDALRAQAYIRSMDEYEQLVREAAHPEDYWAQLANTYIDWFSPYTTVLNESEAPFYRWFEGGTLNASYLCLDRHLPVHSDKPALIWEGESGEVRHYTYAELLAQVNRFANLLRNHGIQRGDRVAIYLPMIPEAIMAMLACARIGAIHVVVFGGFSAEVLKDRIVDTEANLVITADGASRHGKPYLLKPTVDVALQDIATPPQVLVIEHNHQPVPYLEGRDLHYNKLIEHETSSCEPVPMDSEDTLFILHTSGSTGKPKGIQHSTAGYMLWSQWTSKHVFDLHPKDVYWCTADIGWITGHTYVPYGPLALGGTIFIYEGVPTYPDAGRWWKMIETHRITQFYTAPTAIRMLHKDAPNAPKAYDLSSLKVLGSVGEPIDPEAWQWYYETVGNGRCPVIDTWWQTETGGHMIAPLPGATPTKPGSATLPLPGISAEILTEEGKPVTQGEKGLLCITKPWPSMLRSVWGEPARYVETYFSQVKKNGKPVYFSGDGAYLDENGYIIVTGRVDDVINISGHRVGTAEVESAIAAHDSVAECAIVSRPDALRGESIVAFVVSKTTITPTVAVLLEEINDILKQDISAMIKVDVLVYVPGLPKTRSGKILRRILRSMVRGEPLTADFSTLEDPSIVDKIRDAFGAISGS